MSDHGFGTFLLWACVLGLVWWYYREDENDDQWDAFVYSDASLMDVTITRGFKTFELCQAAAIDQIRRMPEPDRGDYECGRKCEFRPGLGLDICEETKK